MGFSTQFGQRAILLLTSLGLGLGCASPILEPGYHYFSQPEPGDAWSRKIEGWQQRQYSDHQSPDAFRVVAETTPDLLLGKATAAGDAGAEPPPLSPQLRDKYSAFRRAQKRALAQEVAQWIQREAAEHYVEDGPVDHWATLQETLKSDGDDCDGLELLAYNFLLDLGFESDEVFRAVVYRRSDGQHHMVTFWFENPRDPWVIDPTGAMTYGRPRMSEVPEWVPLRVFGERSDYIVRPVASLQSR